MPIRRCCFLLQVKSAGRVVVDINEVPLAPVLVPTHTQTHLIVPESAEGCGGRLRVTLSK